MPERLHFSVHDDVPADAADVVDSGLGAANDAAAPLHEVRRLACFARDATGTVVGGAVGRTWGACCELQQLWVEPAHRHRGLGSRLVQEFEARALARHCSDFFLETFSFQAPDFYRTLGYEVAHAHAVYPHGIVRYLMVRRTAPEPQPPG